MSKKTNPKLIGAFVIGATILVITSILAFGGLQYFSSKIKFVAFFPGASLSGLDVGSPVTFRGVKVGQITSIVIQYDVARQRLRVPIRFDLDTNRLQFVSGEKSPERNIPELIARGLRGQLQTVSLVTGQTSIDFNFYPDTPAQLFGSAAGVESASSPDRSVGVGVAGKTALAATRAGELRRGYGDDRPGFLPGVLVQPKCAAALWNSVNTDGAQHGVCFLCSAPD